MLVERWLVLAKFYQRRHLDIRKPTENTKTYIEIQYIRLPLRIGMF